MRVGCAGSIGAPVARRISRRVIDGKSRDTCWGASCSATALAALLNTYTRSRGGPPAAHRRLRPAVPGGASTRSTTFRPATSSRRPGQISARRNSLGDISSTAPSSRGTEAHYIHQQGLSILLIDDPSRTFTSGSTEAHQAITQATTLGVPHGAAIFRDVETSDPITSTYIQTYVAAFAGSGYVAGFYENPINGSFAGAYCSLESSNPAAVRGVLLYSSEPEHTGSDPRRAARPHYGPNVPGCVNHTAAWQYLERGLFPPGTWPNVDVDELPARYSDVLW